MNKILILSLIVAVASANLFPNGTWESGALNITSGKSTNDDVFYVYFESQDSPSNDPLVLWLTGGPGCASEVALFFENGPYKINDDQTLSDNSFSWNKKANLLYVDNPIGTGFSHGNILDLVHTEEQMAADLALFMHAFLAKHPELKGRDFFITGESYAGHYIPAAAYYFLFNTTLSVNLKGIAIGNGLVDPYNQYPAYADFAYENKLVGKIEYYALKAAFKVCQAAIWSGVPIVNLEVCQLPVEAILGNPLAPNFNVYDIREKCGKPPLCYDFSNADKFLNNEANRVQLGVSGRSWVECGKEVHIMLLADWMTNLSPKLTSILEKKINVLAYHGDKDFICNWRGGEAYTNDIKWEGQQAFNNLNYTEWKVNGKAAGALKSHENLHFLRVYDAGHMVPMNQPEAALEMLNTFLNNEF